MKQKYKDLAQHMMLLCDNTEVEYHYRQGFITFAISLFERAKPDIANMLKMYHFNCAGTLRYCVDNFEVAYNKQEQRLKEADILYEKGFDHVDLLMLSDLVDDEDIVEALRRVRIYHRGFWALDILRVKCEV